MPGLLTFLVLLILTLMWLALPLVPSLVELKRKTDVEPLRVVREYDGNVRYFARGFRKYVEQQFATMPPQWEQEALFMARPQGRTLNGLSLSGYTASDLEASFPDGTLFRVVRLPQQFLQCLDERKRTMQGVVISEVELTLAPETVFAMEFLARERLTSDSNSVFRAVLGEKDVFLGQNNTVLRWFHCEKSALVGESSTLYGRASAEEELTLLRGCSFQRLHAPRLVFGSHESANFQALTHSFAEPTQTWTPDNSREVSPGHFFVNGDLMVPDQVVVEANLVVTGNLTISSGAVIRGNTKSHGHTHLAPASAVHGSVVSQSEIRLGRGAFAAGPVIAESCATLEANSCVGSLDSPTTVSAPEIEVAEGVQTFGTVWARQRGAVGMKPNQAQWQARPRFSRQQKKAVAEASRGV